MCRSRVDHRDEFYLHWHAHKSWHSLAASLVNCGLSASGPRRAGALGVRSERYDSGTGAHLFHGTEQNRAYQSSEYNILYGTEYVPMPNLDRRTICQTQYTERMHATLVHRATCGTGSERAVPERERRETMWRARSEIECQITLRQPGQRIRRRQRPQNSHL